MSPERNIVAPTDCLCTGFPGLLPSYEEGSHIIGDFRDPRFFATDEIRVFLPQHKASTPGIILLEGPSGAGKTEFSDALQAFPDLFGLAPKSVVTLRTDWFMKPRDARPNPINSHTGIMSWYEMERIAQTLTDVVHARTHKPTILTSLYRHSPQGIQDGIHQIPAAWNTLILEGRYSYSDEIMDVCTSLGLPCTKILITADEQLRIRRAMQRAAREGNRTPQEQRRMLEQSINPDWLRYVPTILSQTDAIITTNGNARLELISELFDRSHTWGNYCDTQRTPLAVKRIIEIGENGATSVQAHANKHERYAIINGILTVETGPNEHALFAKSYGPGEEVRIPAETIHRARSNHGPVVYQEDVIGMSAMDNGDITKLVPAIPYTKPPIFLK